MSIIIIINGRQRIECDLPTPSLPQTSCRVVSQNNLNVVRGKEIVLDNDTGEQITPFLLHVVYMVSNMTSADVTSFHVVLHAGSETIHLGKAGLAVPVIFDNIKCVGYPPFFTVTATVQPPAMESPLSMTPEEHLTMEIVHSLSADFYQGSEQSTNVQMFVLNSVNYAPTMARYPMPQSWHNFLAQHRDLFYVFSYTIRDVAEHNLTHTCRAGELRIALARYDTAHIFKEDIQRERVVANASIKVKAFIDKMVEQHTEIDAQTLMAALEEDCKEYEEFLRPSFTVFERILRADGRFHVDAAR